MYVVYQPIEMNMGWCITCHRQYEKKFHPIQASVDLLHVPLLDPHPGFTTPSPIGMGDGPVAGATRTEKETAWQNLAGENSSN